MSTTSVHTPRAAATSQNVTLPSIPELFDPNFLDLLIPPQATVESKDEQEASPAPTPDNTSDDVPSTSHQKLTAKGAPTFASTLVATLDAFVGLRTGIFGERIDEYLEKAWKEDPDLTLRIIWSTRSIHDGKGEKELFYRAFGWLFENHPRTAISNIHLLVESVCLRSDKESGKKRQGGSHGYWKDLLNILAMATLDELRPETRLQRRATFLHNYYDGKSRPEFKNNEEQEEWSRAQRIKRAQDAHERLSRKLTEDARYRALYIAVARLFAAQLAKDFKTMEDLSALPREVDKKTRMSLSFALTLTPKWAPTPGGAHDRVTNIASAICLLLSETHVLSIVPGIAVSSGTTLPALEMHSLRCIYQKRILTRGRRLLCSPEPLMSSKRWSQIVYSRVPSLCMNKNSEKFFTHDEERFMKYLQDVDTGKKQISGATLLPHVLIQDAVRHHQNDPAVPTSVHSLADAKREQMRRLSEAQTQVVNNQWNTLVNRLRESGQLDNCIAVCDVSGSMGSARYAPSVASPAKVWLNVEPIWPAIALSLLVARLAKPPFSDSFITFSATPQIVTLDPESARVSLGATVASMNDAAWGMNTDFNAVFLNLILPLAVKHHVPKDQMIKRIFVLSDMQFDAARDSPSVRYASQAVQQTEWKTSHDVIAKAYEEAGYDVPELVYWDLSNPRDGHGITAPVTGEREGVVLLSGYSPSLLKVFMDVEEEEGWEVVDESGQVVPKQPMTPEEFMRRALGRRSFDGLRVVD